MGVVASGWSQCSDPTASKLAFVKLLTINDAVASYPAYPASFYRRFPQAIGADYKTQYHWLEYDNFISTMPFKQPMDRLGYEVWNVDRGFEEVQRIWAGEMHGSHASLSLDDIVVAQAKAFRPDVIVFDAGGSVLLKRLRAEVPSIRLVIGWVGSAIPQGDAWKLIDLLITCAPESLATLQHSGMRCAYLQHAFNPAINDRLTDTGVPIEISFIGSIIRRRGFHLSREKFLLRLVDALPLAIYSPTSHSRPIDYAKAVAAAGAQISIGVLDTLNLLQVARRSPLVARAERIRSPFRMPVNSRLKQNLREGVYGLEYYQTLRDSYVNLNIHADTSPTHASNQRLFEATGVGTCLLTDWKSNIAELFDPDNEVVVYKSAEEAVDKGRWLLEHPGERLKIAEAAKA